MGVSSPSTTRRAISSTFTRFAIACCWRKRQASCSAMACSSISLPLARSMVFRASSRSCRSPTSRSSAVELGEAAERDLDRGDEVALLERLHQVRQRAGVAGLLDELALGEGGDHQHGGEALAGDRDGRPRARRGPAS